MTDCGPDYYNSTSGLVRLTIDTGLYEASATVVMKKMPRELVSVVAGKFNELTPVLTHPRA